MPKCNPRAELSSKVALQSQQLSFPNQTKYQPALAKLQQGIKLPIWACTTRNLPISATERAGATGDERQPREGTLSRAGHRTCEPRLIGCAVQCVRDSYVVDRGKPVHRRRCNSRSDRLT